MKLESNQDFNWKTFGRSKRLLTEKELEEYINLKTEKAKKKFLEDLKQEIWNIIK